MPRSVNGIKNLVCNCGSEAEIYRGICIECRRKYGREYYHRKLAKHAATGGPLVPREERGFCSGRKKQKSPVVVSSRPRTDFGVPLASYVPIAPVTSQGRRIPPADAPVSERLACSEWLAYYNREGILNAILREAGL